MYSSKSLLWLDCLLFDIVMNTMFCIARGLMNFFFNLDDAAIFLLCTALFMGSMELKDETG